MLSIKRLPPSKLSLVRSQLVAFILRHGDRRLTREAAEWLATVPGFKLEQDGTAILLAIADHKLVGILGAADYGQSISFAAVSAASRRNGIGESLIRRFIDMEGSFTCRVNANNYPSLRTCIKAGLIADHCWKGTGGQTILQLVTADRLPSQSNRQVQVDEDASVRHHDFIYE